MPNELVQRACAANRDVPECIPHPVQDCRDVIHIAVFFDGTGNNNDVDKEKKCWSNVAHLYESSRILVREDKSGTVNCIYIPGVGTPFNDKGADWLGTAAMWVEDHVLGGGVGAGGDRRMEFGMDAVNEHLRKVLVANANALGGIVAKYAAENRTRSFNDLNSILAKHRLIKVINLSIFGFSRGAALARAFTNRLIAACKREGDVLLYEGYPIRLSFMGLFDTVASFGVPTQNARTPFTERDLIVSPAVERCVHYVAAHELRFSFPVDLIRKNGKLTGEWLEKTFPGVHSDVGGGYGPTEQSIDNNYARIPLREMMKESLLHGVRMLSYEDLKKRWPSLFKQRFECRRETEAAFSGYMAACRADGGTIEQQIVAHMNLYYSANGTMHRKGIETAGERSRNSSKYKYLIGSKGMASEVAIYRQVLKSGGWLRFSDRTARAFEQYIRVHEWKLAAWDSTAPEGVVSFVSRYVHDSKVDFLGNAEPFSYFKSRGVDESTISVWEEAGAWLRSKIDAVGYPATQASDGIRRVHE
jgi:hypothetical protein